MPTNFLIPGQGASGMLRTSLFLIVLAALLVEWRLSMHAAGSAGSDDFLVYNLCEGTASDQSANNYGGTLIGGCISKELVL
jgi:hypothetical protein